MHPHFLASAQPPSDTAAVESLYAMGHGLFSQERFVDAAAIFRIMLQLAPTDERSWLALGECHERVGQPDVALELYGAGTVANEQAARCQVARARIFIEQGRHAEAEEAIDAAQAIADAGDDDTLTTLVDAVRRMS
ncbi:MAG: tetratricopeptide repeat protein [Polyangiaceae bacterium]